MAKPIPVRVVLLLVLGACSAAPAPAASPKAASVPVPVPVPESPAPTKPTRIERPTAPLNLRDARRYMLALLNRDRATAGLPPLALDEGAAQASGQRHAEDMARVGFLGHWGTDGSVPEERHTEAGGAHMVMENALCFTDGKPRKLDPDPRIDPAAIERAESQFFDEVPPNDGHRRNILRASHTHIGIGIAQPVATATEIPVPCVSQEIVDAYGTYAPLPKKAKVGERIHVEGTLAAGAKPTSVGLARLPLPKPLSFAEANARRSYPVPPPYVTYWGAGFVSPIPLTVEGQRFAIDVPLDDKKRAGLYEVSVWGQLANDPRHVMLGVRTIRVE